MPPLITAAAEIICVHGGRVVPVPSQQQLLIGGSPVLCVPDLQGAPIVGCPVPPTPVTKPCTTVAAVLPGSWSMRVAVGGRFAYMQTLVGLTDGVPPGAIQCLFAGQVIVQG